MRPRGVPLAGPRAVQVESSLGSWIDPAVAFEALYGDSTNVVWLDSGPDASTGISVMGHAVRVITSNSVDGSVIEFLRKDLAGHVLDPAIGFSLGWVGWIGYETRFETMGVDRNRTSPYPDAAFLYLDHAIVFDHERRSVELLSLGDDAGWRSRTELALGLAGADADADSRIARADPTVPALSPSPAITWRDSDAEYFEKIAECQRAIHAGDAYLLCLTTSVSVDVVADPVQTFLRLRSASPSHHAALLRVGDLALISASPERFLSVTPAGVIESRPIKGTRPRGETPVEDAAMAAELATSEKERAENLMIVDLMRNDIARVSRVGSVEVPSLLEVESYAPVHQLVSVVRGQLDDGMTGIDAVVACFPAGSMTGAPKSSATRILDRLEGAPRGIYSGAFGYFGLDGRVDLAMVIRSIIMGRGAATIGTGGGITALSVPSEELAEVKLKAAALLAALGAPLGDA